MDTETLIAQLSADAAPTRASQSPWRMAALWVVGFAVYVGIAVAAVGPRVDIVSQLQTPLFALEIAALVALVASCAISAAVLAFPDMYQTRRIARMPMVFFALFVVVVAMAFSCVGDCLRMSMAECECTLSIALYALLPAALLFYSIRKVASTNGAAAGSVVVLTAFGIGALILRLVEQTDAMPHVVTYHYVPMLAAALIGLALGRKFLRW
jgi:hypothetical protein